MQSVDGALGDEEFRTVLDLARPEAEGEGKADGDSEKERKPAAERLKDWAGQAVGEVLKDLDGLVSNRGATPGVQ